MSEQPHREKTPAETIDVSAVEQQASKSAIQLSTESRGKNRRSAITSREQLSLIHI